MQSTSSVVGSSLSWRWWPSSYTVVVPAHWSSSRCSSSLVAAQGRTRHLGADILVERSSSLGVSGPLTLQSRGCGLRGDHISLPTSFLGLQANSSEQQAGVRARQLAHQFIKLRFGVFDEQGFPGDPLYPSHYRVGGRIYPTGSFDTTVKGVWVTEEREEGCSPDSQACVFLPRGDNRAVTCSLGSLPSLPSLQGYCHKANLPPGPSKQAVLCNARSVLEVINSSHDWATINSSLPLDMDKNTAARVDFVRARATRYVLVLETSADMLDDWKFINKAVQKLVRHDLADSAEVGLVSFSNESRVEAVMTRVGGSRGRLVDSVPDRYRLSQDRGRCVLCGVNTALKDVLGDDKEGAHIIVVTRGGADTLSLSDEVVLQEAAAYFQVQVSSVLVPKERSEVLTFYDTLALESGGRSTVVVGEGVVERYRELTLALSSLLEDQDREQLVEEQLVRVQGVEGTVTEGSFSVDPGLGRDTVFGIYVEDEEEHLVRRVVLRDEEAEEHTYTRLSTKYDSTNLKVLALATPLSLASHVGRRWSYSIQWHGTPTPRQAAVVVTSKNSDVMEQYRINMWSSSDSSTDIVTLHPIEQTNLDPGI